MSAPNVTFPALLQEFFQRRLVAERGMSAHTITSYRDSFELSPAGFLHTVEAVLRRSGP